ncbi:MAG: hypothetical protein ACRCZF_08330, partial [Gemmataceae bacterium]
MRLNRALFLLLLVPLTVLGQGKDKPAPKAGQPLSGKEIAEIWKARQERIKSVKMTWKNETIIQPGHHGYQDFLEKDRAHFTKKNNVEMLSKFPPKGSLIPPTVYKVESEEMLQLSKDNISLTSCSIQFNLNAGQLADGRVDARFNGKVIKEYTVFPYRQYGEITPKEDFRFTFNFA